jgi:hypothetical protein
MTQPRMHRPAGGCEHAHVQDHYLDEERSCPYVEHPYPPQHSLRTLRAGARNLTPCTCTCLAVLQEAPALERRGSDGSVRWHEVLQLDHSVAGALLGAADGAATQAVLLFEVLQHPTSLQARRKTHRGHIAGDVHRVAWAFLSCTNPGVREALAAAVARGGAAAFALRLYRCGVKIPLMLWHDDV